MARMSKGVTSISSHTDFRIAASHGAGAVREPVISLCSVLVAQLSGILPPGTDFL